MMNLKKENIMSEQLVIQKIERVKRAFDPSKNRIQSASSTKTYLQCPAKYYFHYILDLPNKPSIHLVRGNIMHSVQEHFFKEGKKSLSKEDYSVALRIVIQNLLKKEWHAAKDKLEELNLTNDKLAFYFQETSEMHNDWLDRFLKVLHAKMYDDDLDIFQAFDELTPEVEKEYVREDIGLRSFMDCRYSFKDGRVMISDYKSDAKADVKKHELQMGYYSLIEYLEEGKIPTQLSVDFFRHGQRYIESNHKLLLLALDTLETVHKNTKSKNPKDYPRYTSPLCKWNNAKGSGECDYFKECYGC